MKESLNANDYSNLSAEGFVTINYTDPITNKIKEQIKGKNLVFRDAVFTLGQNSTLPGWLSKNSSGLNKVVLIASDSDDVPDLKMPIITGKTKAFGYPGYGGSGLLRGAYNPASFLAKRSSLSTLDWKYVYDFTPIQGLGNIKTIGLTSQYAPNEYNKGCVHPSDYCGIEIVGVPQSINTPKGTQILISGQGIVSIRDRLKGSITSIDISSIVGNNAAVIKVVGYSDITKRVYIMACSTTPSLRFLYEFADDTFVTLLQTYNTSAFNRDQRIDWSRFYVGSNNTLCMINNNQNYSVYNYVNNTTPTDLVDSLAENPILFGAVKSFGDSTYEIMLGKYVMFSADQYDSVSYESPILNTENMEVSGRMINRRLTRSGSNYIFCRHPKSLENNLPYLCDTTMLNPSGFQPAYTRYRLPLDAPERPAGTGMTISYELRVNL